MAISRRTFIKATGATAAGTAIMSGLGFDLFAAEAYAEELKISGAQETTSICCFCSVGCGVLVHTRDGKVINSEGDPEHPISEGSLCSKGSSIYQVVNNENRPQKPRYRAPGSSTWKEVEWDWALDKIAKRIKATRDKTFTATAKSVMAGVEKEFTVNRTNGLAHIGSAALDNEECYLLQKLVRSWGLVHVEHQARL